MKRTSNGNVVYIDEEGYFINEIYYSYEDYSGIWLYHGSDNNDYVGTLAVL